MNFPLFFFNRSVSVTEVRLLLDMAVTMQNAMEVFISNLIIYISVFLKRYNM